MRGPRKPRADSKLKNLPVAQQAEIAELLRTRRMDDARQELAGRGIVTSNAALSEFLSWWQVQQSSLGAAIVDLTCQLRELQRRLDRRDYTLERQASQARAAMALLKRSSVSEHGINGALREVFGIK